MKHILIAFGTRAEALKLYPLIHLWKQESRYQEHLELSTYFTNQTERQYIEFEPDHSAWDGEGRYSTSRARNSFLNLYGDLDGFLSTIDVLKAQPIDAILVQGDTFSTLAGAQAAYFKGIPVMHLEAGLRTYTCNPWPEEKIRVMVDRLADVRFCPTPRAFFNLYHEDVGSWKGQHINLETGNTIIDMAQIEMANDEPLSFSHNAQLPPGIARSLREPPYFLCSLHRRESWAQFKGMMAVFGEMARSMDGFNFKFITHPNGKVDEFLKDLAPNIEVLSPCSHWETLWTLKLAAGVITDSGGLIEEAAYFKRPCFILRDETERMESIEACLAMVVGRGGDILKMPYYYEQAYEWFKADAPCPYGDGKAAECVLDFLANEDEWESLAEVTGKSKEGVLTK